jgi:hypothetical protein
VRWLSIVVLASCAGGSAAPPAISNASRAAPAVSVRMAESFEFLRPEGDTSYRRSCPTAGPTAEDLAEPVLAFARATLYDPTVPGVEVKLQLGSQLGELRISAEWEDGDALAVYCLHVVREYGRVEVVAKHRWSLTSAFSPVAEQRGARIFDGPRTRR